MGNCENTVFNLVLKLTFLLVQYYCVQIVHYIFIFTIMPHSKSCFL